MKGVLREFAAVAGFMCGTLSFTAQAQTMPPRSPAGHVTIHQVSVAFIGSAALGGGSLSYRGKAYRFKVGGLGVGAFGASRLDAQGSVFNLNRLADFNGVYLEIRSGWAAGSVGRGQLWLRNRHGVALRLRAEREGLALALGADGMVVELEH
jgi:hypothetical protein